MGFNLPGDWGGHWRACDQCGARYHASGTDECDCVPCAECMDLVAPTDAEEQDGLCASHYGAREDAREQAEMDEIEKRDERITNLQQLLARAHKDHRKLNEWWAYHLKQIHQRRPVEEEWPDEEGDFTGKDYANLVRSKDFTRPVLTFVDPVTGIQHPMMFGYIPVDDEGRIKTSGVTENIEPIAVVIPQDDESAPIAIPRDALEQAQFGWGDGECPERDGAGK